MEIVQKYYPQDQHMFIFDNATTHSKRPVMAPSARKMMKNPSKSFGAEVTIMDNGKIQYLLNGKPQKHVMQMGLGKFADESPQSFYDNTRG